MKAFDRILENRAIDLWVRNFGRAGHQVNAPHEADAELIRLEGENSRFLAVTIDSLSEEISTGLYGEPFTAGWVLVMSNFSDLAAVGAEPLGIVISCSLDLGRSKSYQEEIARGIEAACRALGTFVLGGDMNSSQDICLTGCALGFVPDRQKMTRVGCREGDIVFLSGRAGAGNALGLARFSRLPEEVFPEAGYRPVARIKEARLIRRYASSCMDTSDGLLITLDQLLRINRKGFAIEVKWDEILESKVLDLCQKTGIPPWFMAAGIHGEFELLFTIPPQNVGSFFIEASAGDFHPVRLGVVTDEPSLAYGSSEPKIRIDMAPLRNLWTSTPLDFDRIVEEHHAWGKKWGLE